MSFLDKEKQIQLAIESWKQAEYPSIRQTADAYGVNRTTLSRRYNGQTIERRKAHGFQQRLSNTQERFLVNWITNLDRQGLPPTFSRVREMATRILLENNDKEPLGIRWIYSFLDRNPNILSLRSVRIDHKRISGTQEEILKDFYDRFRATKIQYKVEPSHIWNMDETGLHIGKGKNGRVLGENRGKMKTFVRDPLNKEWVTIIECVNAAGFRIRPLVIFKGQDIQST